MQETNKSIKYLSKYIGESISVVKSVLKELKIIDSKENLTSYGKSLGAYYAEGKYCTNVYSPTIRKMVSNLLGKIEWRCDKCDEHLNIQKGFNVLTGLWKCTNCNTVNDVSVNNII